MDQWKYIDAKEFVQDYDPYKSNQLEIFLDKNYEHINGRNNNNINPDLVHQVCIHSYKTLDGKLLITRRKEQSYPLSDHNNMSIKYDELIIQSIEKKNIEKFIKELKEEFL